MYVSKYSDNNGIGSKIIADSTSASPESVVKMVSIDSFLADREDRVSFIKADIESYEYNMLRGARETINKYKPRMAVCIYHNPTDVYSIPLLLKELNPEYKLALRHHSYNMDDTVLYAYM